MNAKTKNTSERNLFLYGGKLDVLLGHQEIVEQIDEAINLQFELVDECPCGCGLKNNICNEQLDVITIANDDIPF